MATIKRRKKNTRQRAGTTHGWGSMKKHRGAGHRGGRGNAGTGKRGDAKKPSYWKDLKRYGKHGFTSKSGVENHTINVGHVASSVERLVREGKAANGKTFSVDLGVLGYNLLLGTGIVNLPLEVTVARATPKAVEKIEKAGGKVTQTGTADASATSTTE